MALRFSLTKQDYVPEWDGNRELPEDEQISCKFEPLTVGDMFTLGKETGVDFVGGVNTDDPDFGEKYWGLIEHVLRTRTSDWRNIEVDGEAITTGEDLCKKIRPGDAALLRDVFAHVMNQSSGSVDDEGNSDGQSEPESSDSTLTAEAV